MFIVTQPVFDSLEKDRLFSRAKEYFLAQLRTMPISIIQYTEAQNDIRNYLANARIIGDSVANLNSETDDVLIGIAQAVAQDYAIHKTMVIQELYKYIAMNYRCNVCAIVMGYPYGIVD